MLKTITITTITSTLVKNDDCDDIDEANDYSEGDEEAINEDADYDDAYTNNDDEDADVDDANEWQRLR